MTSSRDMPPVNAGPVSMFLKNQFFTTPPRTPKATQLHEKTMQVNYPSTVLLVMPLLPVLKAKASTGAPARITVVDSMMSEFAKFANRDKRPLLGSFDDTKVTPWDPSERYNVTKLLGQMFLSRLADEIAPEDAIINMVESGLVKRHGAVPQSPRDSG
ncbi:hypothetical protein QQZ08_003792 [Neonectria magnoliae]|uniref:Beta-lactamase-related domain-containing protein n=1 Tax=Neonectria magnoliae TaxID=2732573 RepID=A0ABR1I7Q4_9HYPO